MRGGTKYIEPGAKEPIEIQVSNRYTGKPLLDSTTLFVKIRRISDDFYFDWDDNEFKTAGSVGTIRTALDQVSKTYSPGLYQLDFALERRRRKSVILKRNQLIEQGERVRKSITGDAHPVIAPAMLAKPNDT